MVCVYNTVTQSVVYAHNNDTLCYIVSGGTVLSCTGVHMSARVEREEIKE